MENHMQLPHIGSIGCDTAGRKATGNYRITTFPRIFIMVDKNINMVLSPRQTLNGQRSLRISGSIMKLGTWNVRTMYEAGKIANAIKEMKRMNIQMLGISEHRWSGSGKYVSEDGVVMYYSGNEESIHRGGVGVIVSKAFERSVLSFIPRSDRVMMLKLAAHPRNINVIQCYAPTADKDDEMVEEFYKQIDELLKLTKNHDITIVMGDFNAKIGQGSCEPFVGHFGLGSRNERGDRLIQFCQEEKFIIMNTMFKLNPRRLYTWKSPADGTDNQVIRNQIDYFMINDRFKNSVKSVKTYPGADIGSDHNPVVAKMEVKLKKVYKKKKATRPNIRLLKQDDILMKVQEDINEEFEALESTIDYNNINEAYNRMKTVLNTTVDKHLVHKAEVDHKKWMTDDILNCMEERRICKNNKELYKEKNNEIKKKIREAKEKLIKEECEEIEKYSENYDMFNLHKKIKQTAGRRKKQNLSILLDKSDRILVDIKDRLNRWAEYIGELFDDNDRPTRLVNLQSDSGPPIIKSEVIHAIELMKRGKATGPDNVHADILKLINENGIGILLKLFNKIYDTGQIPEEWLKSTFITLPKITNAKKCKDFRTISLMSHMLKVFLKIIHLRICKKCDENISWTQFGFRKGLGTREALLCVRLLGEKCRDMNVNLCMCFIDYEKAFDSVQHGRMMEILNDSGIDAKDLRIINNLYGNQTAVVRINEEVTTQIEIRRGVRQGCVLSPVLFNMYSESVFRDALEDCTEGISINGRIINNIRFADDSVLIAESMEDLQHLLNRLAVASEQHGLSINTRKTKFMIISKKPVRAPSLKVNAQEVEQVFKYKYLGVWLNDQWDSSYEIKRRIEVARAAFFELRALLCNKGFNLDLKTRILRCYVFPVVLYGAAAWTLTKNTTQRLEAFEMWCYRRMLKISWVDKVKNIEVLQRMCKERELVCTIKKRKIQYFGHFMRGERYELLRLIMQGKIQGKRNPGRRRHSWLRNLRDWFGCNTSTLFRSAASKVKIAMMVANLRRGEER